MEGTIFRKAVKSTHGIAPSAWTLLAEHLGPQALAEEEQTKLNWKNGRYKGYTYWMRDNMASHYKHGLKRDVFERIISSVDYHPGVIETFEELRKRGYFTALLSGGFKAQADKAQKDLKIDHAFAACEYLWDNDGNLVHYNLLPCDYEGKIGFMKLIMKEHGVTEKQSAFVGDGVNDVPLAKILGLSIAFNAAPELQAVCTHSINQPEGKEDFTATLPYLL